MVLEHVDIRILPGKGKEFEAAIEHGLRTVHTRAKGMRGYSVHRCIESPERYVLQIMWDTIEDHMVGYKQNLSPEFRALVQHFFAEPTVMEHFELVAKSGGPVAADSV